MKLAWLEVGRVLLLSLGLHTGCAGSSKGGDTAAGGSSVGGSGVAGNSAGTGASAAGASSGGASAGANSGGTGTGGASGAQAGSGGGSGAAGAECAKTDCGPALGLPNWTCVDGSVGGPTGRCLRNPTGNCAWEINDCPRAGEGGASGQGGQGNAAGAPSGGSAGSSACGGCPAEKICVFQNGGPGPSHFVCATQNPCGAAAACACIVGQGTCQPNLMGDPPGYCTCDNGLN